MAQVTRNISKTKFNTDDVPTEGDFSDLHDSVMWSDESHNGINTQTGASYTLQLSDANKIVETNNASANTVTVPPNSAVGFGQKALITIVQYGAGATTIVAGAGVTINSANGIMTVGGRYKSVGLYKRATDEWILIGAANPPVVLSTPTLTATAISDSEIDLTWSNVSNESSFRLERSPFGANTWTQIGGTIPANVTSYADTALPPSTHYDYRVSAIGDGIDYLDSGYGTDDESTNAFVATLANTTWINRYDFAEPTAIVTRTSGSDTFLVRLWDQMNKTGAPVTNQPDTLENVDTTTQPKLISNGINGLPAIEVKHTNPDAFIATLTPTAYAKPLTRIMVIRPTVIDTMWFSWNNGGGAAAIGYDATGKVMIYEGAVATTTFTLSVNTNYIIWVEFNNDATTKLYVNGTLAFTGTAGAGSVNGSFDLMGRDVTTTTGVCLIADACLYSGIFTSGDRTSITNELKTKYGIA